MVKKKVKKTNEFEKRFKNFNKGIDKFEKEIDKEVKDAEKWVIARRKFFIKLCWTILLIGFLLIISNIFMKVKVA
jgi:hypothetical protein